MNKFFSIAIVIFVLISCKEEAKPLVDVSKINIEVTVDRFEKQFYNANLETLPALKNKYPYLFPAQNADSIWIQKINNSDEQTLFNKSQQVFNDFDEEKEQLADLFKHVIYYHPSFIEPKVITLITNLDYENKVMYADSLLFVSLDMYLGANDEVYKEFPEYLSKNYKKEQLIVDVASAISDRFLIANRNRQFIDVLIHEGKKMYLIDSYLPLVSESQKIGYSANEIEWIILNEAEIWTYFVENNLLYSTDSQLNARFIENAPFSKFFIDIDKESPGRVGVWLGWQIVKSYMNNNNVTLQQLLQTNADEIFKKSKYKPKK